MKKISLPASVTEIHPSAFGELQMLTSFTVSPENPVYSGWENCLLMGDTLVAALGNASGKMTLPEGVRVIGENAFSSQKGLKTVVLPSTLEEIESGAFYGCESLGDIKIPEGVTYLGDRAFYGCAAMTEVILPESLTAIRRQAFEATGLTSVYIPAGVKTIEDDAFSYCESLEELLFGATEKQEGWSSYMAQRCPLLKTENLVLGAENPYAPEEDVSGETSGESSEEISAEASEETSAPISAPPDEGKSFPWGWVILAVAAVAAAVLVVAKKKK
ncbi:MAG: leucine-rich repeat domain-containing protein [Clostridia bacterium]|nr:leucine-rich repeat domain-containing protein [Clostridia bacterium]